MALTNTQQIELGSLIMQKLKSGDQDKSKASGVQTWLKILIQTLSDAHQESLYDDLLVRTIEEQTRLRDEAKTHYDELVGLLTDKIRVTS